MTEPPSQEQMVTIISLASGALVANIVSVTLLVCDSLMSGR